MRWVVAVGLLSALAGCGRPPPPSAFPTARAAIDRMRASTSCSRGVRGESRVDYFGEVGRVRGSVLFVVARPERVRLDVFSPFGVTLSTLTATEQKFSLLDLQNKSFFTGPSNTCNVRRFLKVPVPPHALVELFTGQAPVLAHDPSAATIAWDGDAFALQIASKHEASETIRLEPHPDDYEKPWAHQRVRVREVSVVQKGVELYHVELGDHRVVRTASPRVDPDGIDPDVPPSGPKCDAEVPFRLRFTSEVADADVIFAHKEVVHNPPLGKRKIFEQRPPRGVDVRYSECTE